MHFISGTAGYGGTTAMRGVFAALLAIMAMNLAGCALCRGSKNSSEPSGHYDVGVAPYTEFEIIIITGKVHTGQIVGLEGDRVVILPRPYWNVSEIRVDIERIQSLEVILDEPSSGANSALGMLFGAVLGAGAGIIPAGEIGSEDSTYSDEYDDAILLTYCAGVAGALCGGVIGFLVGGQVGSSKTDRKFSFFRLSKLEKLRTIASISGVKIKKGIAPRSDTKTSVEEKSRKISLFESTCSKGDMRGCFNLGIAYRDGVNVPKDQSKAASLFRKACVGGIRRACGEIATKETPASQELEEKAAAPEDKLPKSPTCPEGTRIVEEETTGGFEKFCARQIEGEETVRHGPTIVFYKDGKRAAEGSYSEGARHGPWTYWYPDGTVKLKAEYNHGLNVGIWIQYSESGKETGRVEYGE